MQPSVPKHGHILHERASQYHWSGAGSLSLKSFYHGAAAYDLAHGTAEVDQTRFLVVNDGQPYTITIDAAQEVESFCVFFAPNFAEQMAYDLTASDERKLDQPDAANRRRIEFFDKTYPHDRVVSPHLRHLHQAYPQHRDDGLWLDEQLTLLMHAMLSLNNDVIRAIQRIPAAKTSTRAELYRRVAIAYDIVQSQFRNELTLDGLARTCLLSPNHLVRTYRLVYGVTPHQHQIALRLGEAKRLLQTTRLSVLEVCLAVGFSSLGSFSAAFHRRTGTTPAQYRSQTW